MGNFCIKSIGVSTRHWNEEIKFQTEVLFEVQIHCNKIGCTRLSRPISGARKGWQNRWARRTQEKVVGSLMQALRCKKYEQFSMKSLEMLRPNSVSTQQIRAGCVEMGEEEVGWSQNIESCVWKTWRSLGLLYVETFMWGNWAPEFLWLII